MNRNLLYSILLGVVILMDSVFTVYVGSELNPILLWIQKGFDLTLAELMVWRTILIWAAIVFLYRVGFENKYLMVGYIALYGICILTVMI
jgi:hypothetical protein